MLKSKELPRKQSMERIPGNSPTIMLWKLLPFKLKDSGMHRSGSDTNHHINDVRVIASVKETTVLTKYAQK
jgi:transcriptional regulator of aromatic amino acid metabolism